MELKDFLPTLGILVGWLLAQATSFGQRRVERDRVVGRSLATMYFLLTEMIQVKMAQEYSKNQTTDVKEWERTRKRAFEQYADRGPEHEKRLASLVEDLAAYFPLEAYRLKQMLSKYAFIKGKSLEAFTANRDMYVGMLSGYEVGYLAYQYELERLVRFLAFKQSKLLWMRLRWQLHKLRVHVAPGDLVFFQQLSSHKYRWRRRLSKLISRSRTQPTFRQVLEDRVWAAYEKQRSAGTGAVDASQNSPDSASAGPTVPDQPRN